MNGTLLQYECRLIGRDTIRWEHSNPTLCNIIWTFFTHRWWGHKNFWAQCSRPRSRPRHLVEFPRPNFVTNVSRIHYAKELGQCLVYKTTNWQWTNAEVKNVLSPSRQCFGYRKSTVHGKIELVTNPLQFTQVKRLSNSLVLFRSYYFCVAAEFPFVRMTNKYLRWRLSLSADCNPA